MPDPTMAAHDLPLLAPPADQLQARLVDQALVTNLDGSPLDPERVWPSRRTLAVTGVALVLLLDTALRGAELYWLLAAGQGWSWAWAPVLGLSWLRGLALLLLPAALLARRADAARACPTLLAATLVLAASEACAAAALVPWILFGLAGLPAYSLAWVGLLLALQVGGHVLGDAALTAGLALLALGFGRLTGPTGRAVRAQRRGDGRRLAVVLVVPAGAVSLAYALLALTGHWAQAPLSALLDLPSAVLLPLAGAWLAHVTVQGRSGVPYPRRAWTLAAGAGVLWFGTALLTEGAIPLGLLALPVWAAAGDFILTVQALLAALATVGLLLALWWGVAGEPRKGSARMVGTAHQPAPARAADGTPVAGGDG